MAFYEHRLPIDVEREAVGGPGFKTNLLAAVSGFEQRNIDWSKIRGEWDLSGRFMRLSEAVPAVTTDMHTMRDFFIIQEGRAHGFRFKDHLDFEIGDDDNPTTDNRSIGTGDASKTIFQVFKRYTFGAQTYDRNITKLVTGKTEFLLDGALKVVTTDYTVDLNTGLVTWNSAPGVGVDVHVACEFDIPVRFDTDHLGLTLEPGSIGLVSQIPVVELKQ